MSPLFCTGTRMVGSGCTSRLDTGLEALCTCACTFGRFFFGHSTDGLSIDSRCICSNFFLLFEHRAKETKRRRGIEREM